MIKQTLTSRWCFRLIVSKLPQRTENGVVPRIYEFNSARTDEQSAPFSRLKLRYRNAREALELEAEPRAGIGDAGIVRGEIGVRHVVDET